MATRLLLASGGGQRSAISSQPGRATATGLRADRRLSPRTGAPARPRRGDRHPAQDPVVFACLVRGRGIRARRDHGRLVPARIEMRTPCADARVVRPPAGGAWSMRDRSGLRRLGGGTQISITASRGRRQLKGLSIESVAGQRIRRVTSIGGCMAPIESSRNRRPGQIDWTDRLDNPVPPLALT